MNERLQELVDLFIHRGCTPEQEKELFDSCLHDPAAAETVRQQLILSLKVRGLREHAEVPADVRNELFRKINLIAAEATEKPARKPAFAWIGSIRLGWSHAVVATVAAAIAVFFVMTGDKGAQKAVAPQPEYTVVTDTVTFHTVDTVREIRNVRIPVYIEKSSIAKDRNEATMQEPKQDIGVHPDAEGTGTDFAEHRTEESFQPETPAIADAREMQVTRTKYLEQYNDVVANAERIQLTSDDRVRY